MPCFTQFLDEIHFFLMYKNTINKIELFTLKHDEKKTGEKPHFSTCTEFHHLLVEFPHFHTQQVEIPTLWGPQCS